MFFAVELEGELFLLSALPGVNNWLVFFVLTIGDVVLVAWQLIAASKYVCHTSKYNTHNE